MKKNVVLFVFLLLFSSALIAWSFDDARAGEEVRAVVLVDSKLYKEIRPLLNTYLDLAKQRRGFDIILNSVKGIDKWDHTEVKQHLIALKQKYPSMDGALLVGNIALPTFFKPRSDIFQVRYFTQYYEDLDGVFERRQAPGSIDPKCAGPEGGYFCNVYDNWTVPEHDFDYMEDRAGNGPEIWVALMPVGLTDRHDNKYKDWGRQLEPYLEKVIGFYRGEIVPDRKMYQVSNQLWDLSAQWHHYGPENIDFYAMNPDPKGTVPPGMPSAYYCMNGRTASDCYVRAPMEDYSSFAAFWDYYQTREWMGEEWQSPLIFRDHMQANNYQFVWANVHSASFVSVLSSEWARNLVNGGLVYLASGCNVAEFYQPKSSSPVEEYTSVQDNVLMSYLYGTSNFITAFGDPFYRGHDANFQHLMAFVHQGDYLGKAHHERMKKYHWKDPWTGEALRLYDLKENTKEMLLGDPFLDLQDASGN